MCNGFIGQNFGIEFFLTGIIEMCSESIECIKKLVELRNYNKNKEVFFKIPWLNGVKYVKILETNGILP